jgi:hypothetical protein
MRVFDSNWTVANKSISSAATLYPETNLYDQRRTKTWRSSGYWEVVSGSNTIVFRETIGVDLTATVTAGEYTTATLITAIKSALEAAGASTYTVSVHTDGRLKIVSDGLGGGGVFQLRVTAATAFPALIGYDTSADKTGSLTYIADLLRIHSSEWIEWDMGFPINPTAFAIVSDRNKELIISPSAVIKIQGNPTNNWSSPSVEITVPFSDYVLAYENTAGFHTSALRYWRFYLEDKDNPFQYVEFGAVFFGESFVTARGCAVFPLETNFVDRSTVVFTENGQKYSTKKPKTQTYGISWEGLTKEDLERYDEIFHEFGLHNSFFISLDPDEAFSTDSSASVRYVKFDDAPRARLISPNNWSMDWTITEEV